MAFMPPPGPPGPLLLPPGEMDENFVPGENDNTHDPEGEGNEDAQDASEGNDVDSSDSLPPEEVIVVAPRRPVFAKYKRTTKKFFQTPLGMTIIGCAILAIILLIVLLWAVIAHNSETIWPPWRKRDPFIPSTIPPLPTLKTIPSEPTTMTGNPTKGTIGYSTRAIKTTMKLPRNS